MNPLFQCIILLVCITFTICDSKILKCRCLGTPVQAVKRNLIVDVKEYKPRPYCKHHEVIVVLEDKSEQCIIPGTKYAKNLLQAKKRFEAHLKTHSMKSTAATTTSGATSSTTSGAKSSTITKQRH
ncbi:C-X-C motif chemokine 11-6-like [Cyprinodon tularosa]|uniref:C-X-C motif chemokine 11-6-like n=1 Tax=Cyprinodon tularosa TaxID=77115 RepID=UPI0018E20C14|nr:C-X-C motif chemokine 11-6-like [Cyprinodon tularosa]